MGYYYQIPKKSETASKRMALSVFFLSLDKSTSMGYTLIRVKNVVLTLSYWGIDTNSHTHKGYFHYEFTLSYWGLIHWKSDCLVCIASVYICLPYPYRRLKPIWVIPLSFQVQLYLILLGTGFKNPNSKKPSANVTSFADGFLLSYFCFLSG